MDGLLDRAGGVGAVLGNKPVRLALLLLCGCLDTAKSVGGFVGGTVAEYTACPTDLVDCGHVYMCEAVADNALGRIEICIDDDEDGLLESAEAMYGPCEPTPRHQGLCIDTCMELSPLPGGVGANAFNGAWCGA